MKRSRKIQGDPRVKKASENQFSYPYYGRDAAPYGELGRFEVEYFQKTWGILAGFYESNKKEIAGNILSLLVFYAMSQIHSCSCVKYLEEDRVNNLSHELASEAGMQIAKYGIVWGLHELGLTETYQIGRRETYHRLNPRFMSFLKNHGKEKFRDFLSMKNLEDILERFIHKHKEEMYRRRMQEISNCVE